MFLVNRSFTKQMHMYSYHLGEVHLSTVTLFEAGIVLSVVGVVVTVMLSISGGRS